MERILEKQLRLRLPSLLRRFFLVSLGRADKPWRRFAPP